MTDNTIILPVIMHMLIAVVLIFLWNLPRVQKFVSVAGSILVLLVSILMFYRTWTTGILTTQAGNWQAPFGITFVSDVFSSMLVLLASIAGVAVSIFSIVGIRKERLRYGYFPILHFLLMGLNGAFLTGDIFNLYVWFEIIIIASFVLMTLGGRKPQIGGGIKYVTINLFASIIFLTAIGILYGLTGSLNIADLSLKIADVENRGLVNVTAMLFFASFGIKSAIFPLYFWLPASYHTPPSAIAAIFAGLLTKVGIYAMLRVFTLIFVPDDFTRNIIIIIATATLLTGAFGALIKKDLRQIFSYLIISHIGYLIAGIGMFTEVALTGLMFYLFHDIMVKTNLFLISGVIVKIRGTVKLRELGGLYDEYPKLSLLIAIVFFSLVGVPPLSGFWPKISLLYAAFETGSWILIFAIIISSFFTLYIIARIWAEVFWKPAPALDHLPEDRFSRMRFFDKTTMILPLIILALVSVYMGIAAENIMLISKHIAVEMIDTSPYIQAVLGTN
ncbi:MAG: Na+/H+ antiporter subunit D [Flavisolibacter sp.]|jgi:multicomponent Na+:H+ antiporter subunit D|nr:Na+/H+ antiporter subunit D [Flavisolibacter sp.]